MEYAANLTSPSIDDWVSSPCYAPVGHEIAQHRGYLSWIRDSACASDEGTLAVDDGLCFYELYARRQSRWYTVLGLWRESSVRLLVGRCVIVGATRVAKEFSHSLRAQLFLVPTLNALEDVGKPVKYTDQVGYKVDACDGYVGLQNSTEQA